MSDVRTNDDLLAELVATLGRVRDRAWDYVVAGDEGTIALDDGLAFMAKAERLVSDALSNGPASFRRLQSQLQGVAADVVRARRVGERDDDA